MRTKFIAPSLLAADFTRLPDICAMLNHSVADWYHLDVMDGRFVPNLTFGMMVVEAFKRMTEKPLDVHLMMIEPEKYIEAFRAAGADVITVHLEACTHLHRTLRQIRDTGAKAGVALNPHTPVALLEDVIEDLDLICLMSVNPGFGGQKFIYRTIEKTRQAAELITTHNVDVLIEIDGGVGLQNAEILFEAGANVLVAGNSVFSAPDPAAAIAALRALGEPKY